MIETLPRGGALSRALRSRTLSGTLGCALLASTALTGPALAQGGGATPPAYHHIDENGVDLTNGNFHFSIVEGSVGAGSGELALVTSWGAYRGDNFNRTFARTVASNIAHFSIVIGNTSRTFSGPAGATSFASAQATGETLVKVGPDDYRYTEADGTVTHFGQPFFISAEPAAELCRSGNETNCRLLGLSTTAPGGSGFFYDWLAEERCWDEFGLSPTPETKCGVFFRLASVSNNPGATITYEYVGDLGSGQPTANWYKRSGSILSSAGGGVAATSYDFVSSNVTEVTDMGGRTWRLTYGSANRLVGIRRPRESGDNSADDITIAYTADGLTLTRDGVTTAYARSVSGNSATMLVTQVDGDPNTVDPVTTVVSDLTVNRPTSITDPLGRTTTISYDAGRPNVITAHEGNSVDHDYDARGNVVRTRLFARPGTAEASQPPITTSAEYPADCTNATTCNRPLTTTDARNNVTAYSYDPTHGGVTRITGPAPTPNAVQPQTRFEYGVVNGAAVLTATSACQTLAGASGTAAAACAGTADEVRTEVSYNSDLSPASVTVRNGNDTLSATTANFYDPIGNLVRVDGPLAGSDDSVRFRYDDARQRVGTISPDPDGPLAPLTHRAERISYRPDGQVSRVESGNVTGITDSEWAAMTVAEQVEIGFDDHNRPESSSLVVGGAVRSRTDTGYDLLGRPLCTAQRMDPSDWGSNALDACSQDPTPSAAFGPDRIARTQRDELGRITALRTAVGTPLEAAEVSTSYTANGQVATLTDGEGNVTAFGYDGHDRLRRTDFPAAAPGQSATFEELTRDPAGNVTVHRLRDGQEIGFVFDALGRLTLKDRPGAEPDVAYEYDLLGRMTGASQPGHTISFAWDALGRMVSETGPLGTVASLHDPAGRRVRVTHRDGNFFVYDHLTTGEVTRIRQGDPATGEPATGVAPLATFEYDLRGRRTTLTRGNGAVTRYAYLDPAGRLSSLEQDLAGTAQDLTLGFAYNPAGQIVTNTRSNDAYALLASGTQATPVDDLNRVADVNGAAVLHDARGNLTWDGSTAFAYDSDNRLVSAAGARAATLTYDPLGRLHRVQGGEGDFRILYEGGEPVTEVGVFGNVGRRFVHGPASTSPWSGTAARASPIRAPSTPTSAARSSRPSTPAARSMSTATTNMASPARATSAASSTPASAGSPRSSSIISTRGCTTRPSAAASCRPTRSAMGTA